MVALLLRSSQSSCLSVSLGSSKAELEPFIFWSGGRRKAAMDSNCPRHDMIRPPKAVDFRFVFLACGVVVSIREPFPRTLCPFLRAHALPPTHHDRTTREGCISPNNETDTLLLNKKASEAPQPTAHPLAAFLKNRWRDNNRT